jgi:hypothetical protein
MSAATSTDGPEGIIAGMSCHDRTEAFEFTEN